MMVAVATDPMVRFMRYVEQRAGGCWLWTGATLRNGYGNFQPGGRGVAKIRAHRWIYEHLVGHIPPGMDLDHLCRVRNCVSPHHLEPVTRSVNLSRGVGGKQGAARQQAKTHCPHGHAYDKANTGYRPTKYGGISRRCKACDRRYAQTRTSTTATSRRTT